MVPFRRAKWFGLATQPGPFLKIIAAGKPPHSWTGVAHGPSGPGSPTRAARGTGPSGSLTSTGSSPFSAGRCGPRVSTTTTSRPTLRGTRTIGYPGDCEHRDGNTDTLASIGHQPRVQSCSGRCEPRGSGGLDAYDEQTDSLSSVCGLDPGSGLGAGHSGPRRTRSPPSARGHGNRTVAWRVARRMGKSARSGWWPGYPSGHTPGEVRLPSATGNLRPFPYRGGAFTQTGRPGMVLPRSPRSPGRVR
jgi:hypothetical protein